MVCLGVLRSRECITYCWGIKDCLCLSCIWWPQNLLSLLYSEGQAFLFLLWLQYLLPQGKVGADMRTVSSQDQQSTMKLKCSILMSASLASSWEVRAGRVGTVSWGHQGVLTWASANVSFVSNDHNSGFFGFFFRQPQLSTLFHCWASHTHYLVSCAYLPAQSHSPSHWAQDSWLPVLKTCTVVISLHALCSHRRNIGVVRLSKLCTLKN